MSERRSEAERLIMIDDDWEKTEYLCKSEDRM